MTSGPAWHLRLIGSAFFGAIPLPEIGPKLLFDEHLPPQLVHRLAAVYPGSAHVYSLQLAGAPDATIWEAARSGGFILVTKDEDFQPVSVFRGHPPKVIWVRLGNASAAATVEFLKARLSVIIAFAADPEAGFLSLS